MENIFSTITQFAMIRLNLYRRSLMFFLGILQRWERKYKTRSEQSKSPTNTNVPVSIKDSQDIFIFTLCGLTAAFVVLLFEAVFNVVARNISPMHVLRRWTVLLVSSLCMQHLQYLRHCIIMHISSKQPIIANQES